MLLPKPLMWKNCYHLRYLNKKVIYDCPANDVGPNCKDSQYSSYYLKTFLNSNNFANK